MFLSQADVTGMPSGKGVITKIPGACEGIKDMNCWNLACLYGLFFYIQLCLLRAVLLRQYVHSSVCLL